MTLEFTHLVEVALRHVAGWRRPHAGRDSRVRLLVPRLAGGLVAPLGARDALRDRYRPGWRSVGWRLILDSVFARVRKWYDGAGWFVGFAVVLFTFALLAVLIGLQSSDIVLWTGQRVIGTEQNGLVSYRWHGFAYSLDVTGNGNSKAVSVYLDPGNPEHAVVDNALDRAAAGLLVGVPLAGGVALLVVGGTRNYRWTRRNVKRAGEFRL